MIDPFIIKTSFWRIAAFMFLSLLSACSVDSGVYGLHHGVHDTGSTYQSEGGRGLVTAVALGPDKRLWRASVEGKHVLVDVSSDDGKTFSTPSVVNKQPQRIKAKGENRLQIAVDATGKIYVVYSAELPQPSSTYYSVSTNGGISFSEPVLISDTASEANTYVNNILLTRDQRALVFWHDERDRSDWRDSGASIYYAAIDPSGSLVKPNKKAAAQVCECCRTAAVADVDGSPVLFARIVYPGNIRDHGLIKLNTSTDTWSSKRVSYDEWKVNVCPEQGPSLSIGPDGRYHVAWFSEGVKHSGLFYAYSSDHGVSFSQPLALGSASALAGHPSVLSLGLRVVVAWQEFDGKEKRIKVMQSSDGGVHWSPDTTLASTTSEADYPALIGDDQRVFLQWTTRSEGFQWLKVD